MSFTAEVVRLKPVDWLLVYQPVFNYCNDVDVHNALKATWLTVVLVGPSMCVYWNVSVCVVCDEFNLKRVAFYFSDP